MDGALVGDLEEARTLFVIKVSLEGDHAINVVDHPFLCLAFGTIGGVNSPVPQPDRGPGQRQALAIGVKPHRHRRAGTERSQEKIVGARPAVEPARRFRVVGEQPVPAGDDFLLKQSASCLAHHDFSGLAVADRLSVGGDVQIALGPEGDQARDVGGIAVPVDEMIGAGERNEALGCFAARKI